MKAILMLAVVMSLVASVAQANPRKCSTTCSGSGSSASCATRC
jgi:hypothetical protein